ncbi:MAG: ribosome biogenesis GTPase Der [Gammaproteobacteria bacterium]|nr:ribosome biogenesis GTPase Der [Gammaproteobacteria bacterium]MBV9696405.1 ribosome biogenesis GTPase Der [Gammaproteobacteria bacterium]
MLPVVALVGRPNVGKSTLFNVLTASRDAIVADVPGLTRDRQYGFARVGPVPAVIIDTGGLVENPAGIEAQMRAQTERAVAEADRVVLVADARAGLTPQDLFVARQLRRSGKPVSVALNKAEGLDPDLVGAEFHSLGFGAPHAISASHGQGCESLLESVLEGCVAGTEPAADTGSIRIAVIGRPNVGKSTLVNRLLGEERVIASAEPGTTRDSILVPFERDGRAFTLIDTAGVRRRARVADPIERASVAKTLQAIEEAHVVVLVLDAHDTVAEQDASVLGLALERGRALVIAVNKWDGIPAEQRATIERQLALKLDFVPFAPLHFISARHGTGVGELVGALIRAYEGAMRAMPTRELTRTLEQALTAHQPPLVRGRRIKLRYAHQGGRNPPRIVIHGNQTAAVPEAYTRYLANVFRKAYDLFATPVVIEYRTDANPYAAQRPRPARRAARGARRGTARRR